MARKNANNPRGHAEIDLGFRKLKLRVTLQAMADVEDAFDCEFSEIEDHLGSTRKIATLIACFARAAGEDVSDEDVAKIRRAPIEMHALMSAISASTRGTAGEPEQAAGNEPSA